MAITFTSVVKRMHVYKLLRVKSCIMYNNVTISNEQHYTVQQPPTREAGFHTGFLAGGGGGGGGKKYRQYMCGHA